MEAYREMWEELHNPDFKRVQFEAVKNEAGLNRFVGVRLFVERWCAIILEVSMVYFGS